MRIAVCQFRFEVDKAVEEALQQPRRDWPAGAVGLFRRAVGRVGLFQAGDHAAH
ncbi:MAG: hypothetical protein HND48_20530 [Chloroflexi bacterium]|nr:hypothetical protein [Chloroflexota bacterium]